MPTSSHRPRGILVNGISRSRTYHYYWCRRCHHSIRTTTTDPSEILCPRCFGQIRHELDVSRAAPLLLEPSAGARALDALARALDPPDRHAPNEQSRTRPARIILEFIGGPDVPPGPDEYNQELTQNDRPGPPPAPGSAIEALPVVELNVEHLKADSCCPVCKDDFNVGMHVRQLPCMHIYHHDCIIPWLHLHNTCPVCRHEIGGSRDQSHGSFQDMPGHDASFLHGSDDGGDSEAGSWRDLFSLRPFSLVLNWAQLCLDFIDDRFNNNSNAGSPW